MVLIFAGTRHSWHIFKVESSGIRLASKNCSFWRSYQCGWSGSFRFIKK